MDLIMSITTYPLDDIEDEKDEPCLLVSCPTTQLAIKLLHHTVDTHTEGVDAYPTLSRLAWQGIADERVSVILNMCTYTEGILCL